jgi:hypothetical protein
MGLFDKLFERRRRVGSSRYRITKEPVKVLAK